MKIATWNVNSLKVRLPQVLSWLESSSCDILALQELKQDDVANSKIVDQFAQIGYNFVYNAQKTYNGVAIISKHEISDVVLDIPNYTDVQKRVISATIADVRVICGYFVNGDTVGSEKYSYKLEWLDRLYTYVAGELDSHAKVILLGDYNIAPEDIDVYDPQKFTGGVLCSEPERKVFFDLIDLGLIDSFREFNQQDGQYTWWDYRNFAFRRKNGLRIDHILATPEVMASAKDCTIDKTPRSWERPSDHTPIILEF